MHTYFCFTSAKQMEDVAQPLVKFCHFSILRIARPFRLSNAYFSFTSRNGFGYATVFWTSVKHKHRYTYSS